MSIFLIILICILYLIISLVFFFIYIRFCEDDFIEALGVGIGWPIVLLCLVFIGPFIGIYKFMEYKNII
jgi:hypothetical protein